MEYLTIVSYIIVFCFTDSFRLIRVGWVFLFLSFLKPYKKKSHKTS